MISLQTLELIGSIAAVIASIFIGILYSRSKVVKDVIKATDAAEEKLVVILQGTVTALERKVGELEKAQTESAEKIKVLQTDNEVMNRVLQGKDGRSEEMYKLAKENSMNIEKLYGLMERHINLVEKALNITATAQHAPAI